MSDIECFFDCSSPWTYIGFHNVQALAKELDVSIRWRPILVGGIFNSTNPTVYESRSNPVPAKRAHVRKSVLDWARWSGLEFGKFPPTVFPVNSAKVMRGCLVLEKHNKLVPFARAAFEAYWRDNLDLSEDSVVDEICRRVGEDPETLRNAIKSPSVKEGLRANTSELVDRGGFGSPTFFLDGTDMYFGNDQLPLVRAKLLQTRPLG